MVNTHQAAADNKIIVALDFPDQEQTLRFIDKIDVSQCRLKIGKQLFTAAGPALVKALVAKSCDVFLDLKFHDIPNTVAKACQSVADLGVWMLNVHAMGGGKMLSAAREAIADYDTKLVAVTLLTSSDQTEMDEVGLSGDPESLVLRLAELTEKHGLDGIVCSASEAVMLRKTVADSFCLVTPGIRLDVSAKGDEQYQVTKGQAVQKDDQKRIVTPRQAISNGSSYLVIGRPITQASDPAAVLQRINQDLCQET